MHMTRQRFLTRPLVARSSFWRCVGSDKCSMASRKPWNTLYASECGVVGTGPIIASPFMAAETFCVAGFQLITGRAFVSLIT